MYLTLRDRPEGGQATNRRVKQRVASTVVLLGLVSMFTDISSESVNAVLPIYLTTVLSMWFNSTQREEPYPGLNCE